MARLRPHVTVVGLGPAGTDLLGDAAAALLAGARARLPADGAPPGGGRVDGARSFDDLYESAATFDEVYAAIVEELVAAASDAAPGAGRLRGAGVTAGGRAQRGAAAGRRPGRR